MKFKDLRISTLLALGFSITSAAIMLLGFNSLYFVQKIGRTSALLYDQPITIANSVRDIQIHINSIRRLMKAALLIQDAGQLEDILNRMYEDEKEILSNFDTIIERDSGNIEDVNLTYQIFVDWIQIRDEALQFIHNGEMIKAADILMGQSAAHVDSLMQQLQEIFNFANNNAIELVKGAQDLRKTTIKNIAAISAFVFLVSLLFALISARRISAPLDQILGKIKKISNDQYNHDILSRESNQLAVLDGSVEELKKAQIELKRYRDRLEEMVKKRTKALKESEDKYRQLFEMSSDALFLIDVETSRILDLNDTALKMYGYSREEALQMKNTEFSAEPAQTRQATVEQEQQIPIRYHKKKDGTCFPTDISGAYYTWNGREVCIAAIRDQTERMQAEAELEKHRGHLEALVKERTAELEEKNAELERFNQLFVGREFRIKELKEKVKALEGKSLSK